MNQFRFSLIIPVFQTVEVLTLFLESLLRSIEYPTELLLYNDGSGEGVQKKLEALSLPDGCEKRIVFRDYSHGCVDCINDAFHSASGDYFVLLDSDTILPEGWQTRLLEDFNAHPEAGAIGPLMLFPQWGSVQNCGMVFSECLVRRRYFMARPEWVPKGRLIPTQSGVFAFCAIPAKVVRKVGDMDVRFFNGNEDVDYQLRIGEAGYPLYIDPEICIYHWEKSNGIHRVYNQKNNLVLLWTKHHNFIRHDLWDLLEDALTRRAVGQNAPCIGVDLCESRVDAMAFWQKFSEKFSLTGPLDYSHRCSIERDIWLPELMHSDAFRTPQRYLFLCDGFNRLLSNDYWYRMRRPFRQDDLIVDMLGNVLTFAELESSFWPGSKVH